MKDNTSFQTKQRSASREIQTAAREARALISRRKFTYAAFMLMLLAAAAYAGSTHVASTPSSTHRPVPTQTALEPKQTALGQSAEVNTSVTSDSSTDAISTNSTSVTVNGTNIPVPDNGSAQTTVGDNGGTTSVNVSHSSSGGASYNYSSLDVNVQTNSNSQEGGNE